MKRKKEQKASLQSGVGSENEKRKDRRVCPLARVEASRPALHKALQDPNGEMQAGQKLRQQSPAGICHKAT